MGAWKPVGNYLQPPPPSLKTSQKQTFKKQKQKNTRMSDPPTGCHCTKTHYLLICWCFFCFFNVFFGLFLMMGGWLEIIPHWFPCTHMVQWKPVGGALISPLVSMHPYGAMETSGGITHK